MRKPALDANTGAKPASRAAKPGPVPVVLAVDIGGSHVKILLSSGGEERKVESGPDMTAEQMVAKVTDMAKDLAFDVVSMGYPGPVAHNRIILEPHNLGGGWVGYDFETSLGKPVIVLRETTEAPTIHDALENARAVRDLRTSQREGRTVVREPRPRPG